MKVDSVQGSLFAQGNVRDHFDQLYQEAYEQLNPEQREAVNQIEGPVMVLAGPGTGKTQILAMRIGKILAESDAGPHNILCLTFTDAAAIAMRERLVSIIGPDAHRVHIFTYHSFCNQVIQENLGIFGNYRRLQPITDLERLEIFHELMTQLPDDHRLKKLKGDPKYEINRLANLFSLMKKENYTAEHINTVIDAYYEALRDDPDMYYKKSRAGSYQKGEFKQNQFDKILFKMEDLKAGAYLFDSYQKLMTKHSRYDYDDMITWVLNEFESGSDLLLEYQERYHYFLVDEYQDTNGAQNALLELLISFWQESPNVFVVGDDDQAIYKFQGANMGNITSFLHKYDPSLVMLVRNYRSTQTILDLSTRLINYNRERIIHNAELGLEKNLISESREFIFQSGIQFKKYKNTIQEQTDIATLIEDYAARGVDLDQVAILYRNHRQVEKLVTVLEKNNVPLNIRRRVNVLQLPLVRNILNILGYINSIYLNEGYSDKRLFELMHYNFFQIKSLDISKLIWNIRHGSSRQDSEAKPEAMPLRMLIADKQRLVELDLESIDEILALSDLIDKWTADIPSVTLQTLFQNVINEGQILNGVLQHPESSWKLQVLNTLFDWFASQLSVARALFCSPSFLHFVFAKIYKNNVDL